MEVKSLLEKIDNSSKRRLYRVGCDDEINKLYDTIDEVTSKLKDRVRSIDTIMYHIKNNNYNITYTTSWFALVRIPYALHKICYVSLGG